VAGELQRFTGRVQVEALPELGLPRQRYAGELFTDGQGRPLRHVLQAELGESYSRVEITLAGGRAEVRIEQGPSTRTLSLELPEGTLLQANNFIGYFELLLASAPRAADGGIAVELLSSNSVQVFPYRARRVAGAEPEVEGGERLEDSLGQSILLDADGRVLAIELSAQGLAILRSDERPEPFTLAPPASAARSADLEVEPVEIRHGEVVLAAEITRRAGAGDGPGAPVRRPALFFVSGSSGQDRHGLSAGIDLGTHEILDRLTREGFLVLRVDDRGVGESRGPTEDLDLDDLIADARACVDFLLARPDVDPERLALLGHSEGGGTAAILAAERPAIAALVLLAATGRPIGEVLLEQNARALDLAGVQGEERTRILAEVESWLERLASDERIAPDQVPADYHELLAARAWLASHARQDPRANLARVRCPVLILQGQKDFQVSAERDARLLALALDEAGHEDHELVVFPDLDHLFKRVEGGESQLSDYFERRPIDPAFLDVLVAWLAQRLQPADGR
jgi:pimeloyl-ACP methyl ester carboxylesterase